MKETGILVDKPNREQSKTVRTTIMLQNVCESSSINQSVKSLKQCIHPRILLLCQKVCEAPSISIQRCSQQLNISETSLRWILPEGLGMTPFKVQLVQELKSIDHSMRFCIAKWACDRLTEDADFHKKNHLFRWSSFWSCRVCKQAKLLHLRHRKPARIHWKADVFKTSHCLVRILV